MQKVSTRRHLARVSAVLSLFAATLVGTLAPVQAAASAELKAPALSSDVSLVAASTVRGCGTQITKPNGDAWRCTFADNFSGSTLNTTKWSPLLTARTGVHSPECRVDTPGTIRVARGSLKLTVREKAAQFDCLTPTGSYPTKYVGGGITSYGKFNQAYGRFEIRAKFPPAKVRGLHSALWMFPQEQVYGAWPRSGEIDIAEFRTALPGRVIPTLHYWRSGEHRMTTNNYCRPGRADRFHKYTLTWSLMKMTIKYDGNVCLVRRFSLLNLILSRRPFDHPFALILNQSLGIFENSVTSQTPLPATMHVDYVRAWK